MRRSESGTEPPYEVALTPRAARDVRSLPRQTRERIRVELEHLAREPRGPGVAKLTGLDAYRVRSGAYRIVFRIDDAEKEVLVLRVAHRRTVYKRLPRLP